MVDMSICSLQFFFFFFFFQAEDGIRDVERSRGLGDVYKRQVHGSSIQYKTVPFASNLLFELDTEESNQGHSVSVFYNKELIHSESYDCLLYTSDAADDTPCVDLGGRRIIKKTKTQ
eukprot:TRINITY_DN25905_c0_g1_i1.p2 TRINITY_DN25905_c0_g1~~TRINITY_DN25905_c0_g1_i1.p2  ORF type:complete len:117 (+),score=44.61 TRINITY_DN25905_c0_g1_i1:34-384(+)